jgi:hypothetical protein
MPGGRPTEYKPEYCQQARKLGALGAVDKEIADFFEVSEVTLNAWKKKYPEFLKSLKAGKADVDKQVEDKLLARAMGYNHPETKFFVVEGEIVKEDTIKHYPPDVKAQQYWLNNRKPKEWRNRHEVKADVTVNESLDKKLTDGRQNLRKKLEEKTANDKNR